MNWRVLIIVLAGGGAGAWAAGPVEKEAEPIGPVFEGVAPRLEEGVKLIDKQEKLPNRTLLFGEDKRSNRRKIEALLDEAIEALGVSGLNEQREQIHEVEKKVREGHRTIGEYQRKRVSAPKRQSLGVLGRANPFTTTRERYEELIANEQENIAAWEAELKKLRTAFAASLKSVGLELDDASVESLLSSVTGDDVVSMAIVFDNVRKVTDQLQILTEQSGEQVDTARRYYGMYVVLVEVLDHIQETFIADVNDRHVPALGKFAEQAQKNIDEAERLIKKKGGDERVLRANIAANQTTRQAAELYAKYLKEQAQMVRNENAEVKKTLATAMNTYRTVKLSSDLAALMASGRQSFNTLMRLRLPYLREFQNEAMKKEFQRMTERLKKE